MAPLHEPEATLLERYARTVDPRRVRRDVPLAPLTTFGIGGPADLFYRARTSEELCHALGVAREMGVPSFLLGRGANILVGDGGFRGVVIRCDIATMEFRPGGRVVAGAGLDTFPDLINATVARGLGGLHHFVGIPSTVGGAVWQNLHFLAPAPARERTMFWEEFMEGATILTPGGEVRYESTGYFRFGYDYSIIHDTGDVVLDVSLKLVPTEVAELRRIMRENLAWRDERHPDLWLYPCAGSIFKKIEGIGAGRLVDECGLKGHVHGAAQIFHKHANIIVNLGGATAAEVVTLIELSRETVARETGFELETEIEFVGEF
ncbi:MAG: UDP-N-acetylmuramate dehydrogenase [Gemmatimonadota bacterium]|nr:UDP-N-acetylmuramate dehydrogenase [Gemmatimonadota bacterium]MDE2865095.1 UDP-N-acetylmuramate dehydrogenase [Gemmatimonadota bacterium]